MTTIKTCSRCLKQKSANDFNRDRSKKDGLTSRCAACSREAANESYRRNRDKIRERDSRPEVLAARRDRRLVVAYGINREQYNEMLAAQGGVCAVCGKHPSELDRSLAVDHCHTGGHVRGLLCGRCNMVLGAVSDDQELLTALAQYLESTKVELAS